MDKLNILTFVSNINDISYDYMVSDSADADFFILPQATHKC